MDEYQKRCIAELCYNCIELYKNMKKPRVKLRPVQQVKLIPAKVEVT